MSAQEIMGRDEIDALINGAKQDAPVEPAPTEGVARGYDFGRSARIVRGRMPTLETVNDRFVRLFRATIYNLLRRTAVIAPASQQFVEFGGRCQHAQHGWHHKVGRRHGMDSEALQS